MDQFWAIRVDYKKQLSQQLFKTVLLSSYKNITLSFGLIRTAFFFTLVYMKWLIANISPDNHKSSKLSIGAIMKNPEMLEFIPDQLKTKEICKHAIKNFLL